MKEQIQVINNNNNNNNLNSNGNKTPVLQYLAAITSTLAIVTDGMHYGWSSPSVPKLTNNETCTNICITKDQGSWLAVMPLIGAIIGSLTAASIVDILGRKKAIMATAIPFFTSWLMIAYGQSASIYYVARLIAGIADGVTFTVVPMYIGEIADANVRGMLGSSCSVTWIAGFLIINIIGSYLSIKTTALLSSIVPAFLFFTFIWMPESPYYLIMRGHEELARKSLKAFKRKKNVESDIERINNAILQERQNARKGRLFDLFTIKSNRKAVIIIGGLRGFQQLSGTTAIAFHTHEIFNKTGAKISEHLAVIVYYSVQLLMTILSSSIVDKAGRKPLLLISMAGTALTLAFEGTYFYILTETNYEIVNYSYLAVGGLILFVILFGLGMQSIPILMLSELFPTSVKAFALCFADVYFSVMATIASKFLAIVGETFGYYMVFYGFTIFSLIGLVFILFFVPETKGKTLEQIQDELRNSTIVHDTDDDNDDDDDDEEKPDKPL